MTRNISAAERPLAVQIMFRVHPESHGQQKDHHEGDPQRIEHGSIPSISNGFLDRGGEEPRQDEQDETGVPAAEAAYRGGQPLPYVGAATKRPRIPEGPPRRLSPDDALRVAERKSFAPQAPDHEQVKEHDEHREHDHHAVVVARSSLKEERHSPLKQDRDQQNRHPARLHGLQRVGEMALFAHPESEFE